MTRRRGTWPAYRRSRAPAGCCLECWQNGGAPVAGTPYIWSRRCSTAPREPIVFYCDPCAEAGRVVGVDLVPIILPTELTAALHCPSENAGQPA